MAALLQGTPWPPAAGGGPASSDGSEAGLLPVHILLGGNGINAQGDAVQSDAAGRLMMHCCTARDSVYQLQLPRVFGMLTPASLYTPIVMRALALHGLNRVAVLYTKDSPLQIQPCESALSQVPPLAQLRDGFSAVVALNYTAEEAAAPDFFPNLADRLKETDVNALVACDEVDRTEKLLQAIHATNHRLGALWVNSHGQNSDFAKMLTTGGEGDYALTTVQWLPSLPYADPAFGTAAAYAAAYRQAMGAEPTGFSAGATATGYVLLTALQRVVRNCNLTTLPSVFGNVSSVHDVGDWFMWGNGSVRCVDPTTKRVLQVIKGEEALEEVLKRTMMDTFFGPVAFNNYRQNYYHPAVTTQVLGKRQVPVLPLEVAEAQLVMPIPEPPGPTPEQQWAHTPAGIAIIVAVCVLGVTCLTLLAIVLCRGRKREVTVRHGIDIDKSEIKVDIAPLRNVDGSYEPGEGLYRGTRVKLVVATELVGGSIKRTLPTSPGMAIEGRERAFTAGSFTEAPAGLAAVPSGALPRAVASMLGDRTYSAGLQPGPGQCLVDTLQDGQELEMQAAALGIRRVESGTVGTVGTAGTAGTGGTGGAGLLGGSAVLPMLPHLTRVAQASSLAHHGGSAPSGHSLSPLFARATPLAGMGGGTPMAPPHRAGTAGSSGPGGGGTGGAGLGGNKLTRSQMADLVWRAVRLQHPGICPILGIVWEWPGLGDGGAPMPVTVRQWYEFSNLEELLHNETVALPIMTRAGIVTGLAEALGYLHAQEPAVVAGPIDAGRILLDRRFCPHMFLPFSNLSPDYAAEPAALQRQRTRLPSIFGGGGRSAYFYGTSVLSKRALVPSPQCAPSASPVPPQQGTPTAMQQRAASVQQMMLPLPQLPQLPMLPTRAQTVSQPHPTVAMMSAAAGDVARASASGSANGGANAVANASAPGRMGIQSVSSGPAGLLSMASFQHQPSKLNTASGYTRPASPLEAQHRSPTLEGITTHAASQLAVLLNMAQGDAATGPSTATAASEAMPRVTLAGDPDLPQLPLTPPHVDSASAGRTLLSPPTVPSAPGNSGPLPGPLGFDRPSWSRRQVGASPGLGPVGALNLVSPIPPNEPYWPSKERDVYEFGLLMLRLFVPPMLSSSPEPSVSLSYCGGSNETDSYALQEEQEFEAPLQALAEVSPELSELAKSCLQNLPSARPTFAIIVADLNQIVPRLLASSTDGGHRQVRNPTNRGIIASSVHVLRGSHEYREDTPSGPLGLRPRDGTSDGASLRLRGSGTRRQAALPRDSRDAGSRSSMQHELEPETSVSSAPGPRVRPRHSISVGKILVDSAHKGRVLASDDLLYDIFPPKVARALQAGEEVQPERYDCVSIFFSDVVGYTDLCAKLQPNEVVDLAHRLYSRFDALIQHLKLFKVETVGDAYLAVGNLRWPQPDTHARLLAQFALEAVAAANSLPVHRDKPELGNIHIRVGLHCGPVVASVVGTLNRRYGLFGDSVNTAARMEHNSEQDRVHCSAAFAALLREQWPDGPVLVSRGIRQIKGKGPMETFWVER
ncbi:hypothetical protein HYH03_007005 [Edaphochlamys debaryana]|uniref:Guanylate cyclase domain-containing protein n=1 Tax=Edaphochlamys debaryana TaxID=47281 RepID=A0A835Y2J1_9CHLO|nr:hypothetical protein HYH03_007005 [Edaphochlamys debaryana]|eukprot:KAG2494760.1 hypothetical protein HYH03_007005 [Edaphochlamys debaryana]